MQDIFTYHFVKVNIIYVLDIIQIFGCCVKGVNKISLLIITRRHRKNSSEHDQEIPQSQTASKPVVL